MLNKNSLLQPVCPARKVEEKSVTKRAIEWQKGGWLSLFLRHAQKAVLMMHVQRNHALKKDSQRAWCSDALRH